MNKSFAFTLAEILIVIGIIGVVSVLTLPSLNTSRGDKETVTRVKKIYSDLNDAYGRARASHGPLKSWLLNYNNENLGVSGKDSEGNWENYAEYSALYKNRTKIIKDRFAESLKISKTCDDTNMNECYVESKTNAIGEKKTGNDYWWDCTHSVRKGTYAVILEDGASVLFNNYTPNANLGGTIQRFLICADVDGPYRGPNAYGRDLFIYWIDNDEGVLPGGYDFTSASDNPCGSDNDTCTAWVIQKGNLDYTKTSDGKTCPNGKILKWAGTENANCK